jgi:hypothetical protein
MNFATLFQSNSLSTNNMQSIKGGNGGNVTGNIVVNIETMVEVTTTNAVGTTEMLFCDRRRKKVNC